MSSKNKTVIFLTACINPKNTPDVAKEREQQYLYALRRYVSIDYPIVFIDNSDTISPAIQNVGKKSKDFEYYTFTSTKSNLGKGHGEEEILDFGFKNSSLLAQADRVIKITGRYWIDNIVDLIEKIQDSNADAHVNFGLNSSRADSRIIIFKPSFYIFYFKPCLEKYLDEPSKIFFENVLAQSVHKLMAERGVYEPWPVYPFYYGINGANGKEVNFKGIKRIKYNLFYKIKLWFMKQIV